MARKSLIEKNKKKPKFKVRAYNRCSKCGRPRAYMRYFSLCRICFVRNYPWYSESKFVVLHNCR